MTCNEQFTTQIVSQDGVACVYLRSYGRTVTIALGSPDVEITIHGLLDLPILRVADPELVPHLVGALRSVLGALESL
jgi:hypothetical protein